MHVLFLYAIIVLSHHVLLPFSYIIQILHVCRPAVAAALKKKKIHGRDCIWCDKTTT